jgi:hypothetical protein
MFSCTAEQFGKNFEVGTPRENLDTPDLSYQQGANSLSTLHQQVINSLPTC